MKKLLTKNLSLFFICSLLFMTVQAQELDLSEVNSYDRFQSLEGSTQRFTFFFNSANRYRENSPYDWIDVVNDYVSDAKKQEDSTAIRNYKLIQSQIYHDLGDFDKGLAIAKEVYAIKDSLEIDQKTVLLDIMDSTFGQLEMYDDQMDMREEKKESGIIDNIYFYDIYSNLGMYRRAMQDYYDKVKPSIDEKDYYAQAEFYNNVGSFLRLSESTPTALSNYEKAEGFVTVFISDILRTKTEKAETKGHMLKGIIEGNIGKCHAQ
ncbi:MAG: histidine kinase, partial [Aurantibacter sp.]